MTLPQRVRRLFQFPFRGRGRVDRELDDEFAFHLDMRVAELVAAGATPAEARREALRRFGDTHDAREYCGSMDEDAQRAHRRRDLIGEFVQDARWALRQVTRNPGFTALAAITLALGIGATVSIYSTINRLLFNPLPFPGGNQIVALSRQLPNGGFYLSATPDNVQAWRERVPSFEQVSAVWSSEGTFGQGIDAVKLDVGMLEPLAGRMLHLRAIAGRAFTDADGIAGAPKVAMLGEGLWKRRFGGAQSVLGTTVTIDDESYTVVGVAPAEFVIPEFAGAPESAEVWLPLSLADVRSTQAIARLRSGATTEQASREMTAALREQSDATQPGDVDGVARRPQEFVARQTQNMLYVLFGAVAVVLLIGCSNVANLLLARAVGRQRELAVRSALGAGRGRLIRQLLTESTLLALIGGVLGIIVARVATQAIIALRPERLSELDRVQLDMRAAIGAIALALVTGIVFGLAPALFATPRRMGDSLRGTRGGTGSGGSTRMRSALVIAEVALSVTLLIGAGLLMRSLAELQNVDVGFDTRGITGIQLRAPRDSVDPRVRLAVMEEMTRRVARLPGIRGATLTMGLPGQMGVSYGALQVEGRELPKADQVNLFGGQWVQPDYFSMIGLPVVAGRVFDAAGNPPGFVINEGMARRFWPGENAVGKRMRIGDAADWRSVVGVVGDIRFPGVTRSSGTLQIYSPFTGRFGSGELLVRIDETAPNVMADVAREVAAVDSRWSIGDVGTMDASIARYFEAPRFSMVLLGVFAFIAALLATVGLYGVIAYTVTQRTREMGIRMALGASHGEVRSMVVKQGARLGIAGIILGVVIAIAATRLLRAQLYEVSPLDPLTFAAVALLLSGISLMASYVPARRATRVDPIIAVRAE